MCEKTWKSKYYLQQLKETRKSSKIRRKNDSSTPKNVPQNSNECTCDYLFTLVCEFVYANELLDFKG